MVLKLYVLRCAVQDDVYVTASASDPTGRRRLVLARALPDWAVRCSALPLSFATAEDQETAKMSEYLVDRADQV